MKNSKDLFESIDVEKIILNEDGKYPRKVIFKSAKGSIKEYRLIKTKLGNLVLNK